MPINVLALLRKYWLALLTLCSVALNLWLATRKNTVKVETVVEYRDKVVVKVEKQVQYVDRVQVKTRTIVKKGDETRVEERTETGERSVNTGIRTEAERTVDKRETQSVVTESESPRTILSGSYDFSRRSYSVGVLYRILPGLPVSVGPVVNVTNKVFTLGVGIGVQL